MFDEPDNVIPFPVVPRVDVADKLDAIIKDVMAQGDAFIVEFEALLKKHGFKQSYIDAVKPVFMEGFMNDDEKPLWFDPDSDDVGKEVDDDPRTA